MDRRFDRLSLWTFVMLGLPDGVLGTVWPAMRHSFGVPIGDLGVILLFNTLGSMLIAPVVGRLITRLGVMALLALAGLCFAVAAVGCAAAPGLWLVFTVGPLAGVGGGLIDGGLNTAMALTGRGRLLNLLHGFYGVGTAIGPLLVTVVVLLGSWRMTFVVLALLDVVTVVLWLGYRARVDGDVLPGATSGQSETAAPSGELAPGLPTGPADGWSAVRTRVVLGLGLAAFFLYVGLEVSAGQWETSYARYHLGLSAAAAGLAAFGYWGSLTAARISLALATTQLPPALVVRWGVVASILSAAVIWWAPDPVVAVVGFLGLGASNAGVFPALVSLTPLRVGTERAHHAIGWQVGAGAGGGSALSALIGLLINRSGLIILGPALVLIAVTLFVTTELLERLAPR